MPIRPQLRFYYPIDWPQLSAAIRFGRAKGRCEHCGRPHGQTVEHMGDGRWWDAERQRWRDSQGRLARKPTGAIERRTTKVILAAAHLDHDPTNNRATNLAALCQRCHLMHDRREHLRRRLLTYRSRMAVGDLFLGRYHW